VIEAGIAPVSVDKKSSMAGGFEATNALQR
jgi:hypothetical protein